MTTMHILPIPGNHREVDCWCHPIISLDFKEGGIHFVVHRSDSTSEAWVTAEALEGLGVNRPPRTEGSDATTHAAVPPAAPDLSAASFVPGPDDTGADDALRAFGHLPPLSETPITGTEIATRGFAYDLAPNWILDHLRIYRTKKAIDHTPCANHRSTGLICGHPFGRHFESAAIPRDGCGAGGCDCKYFLLASEPR